MDKNVVKNHFSDFMGAITAIAEEKGINKDKILETVEMAIAAAYKKEYGKRGQNVRAELNPVSGKMKFFLVKEVVDESVRDFTERIEDDEEKETGKGDEKNNKIKKEINNSRNDVESEIEDKDVKIRFNPERDVILEEAIKNDSEIKVGDTIEEELPTYTDFGRVAAQTAKQVIIQRIREAERESMFEEYKEKEGEIISGTVQRIEGRVIYVDLGKSVGLLFPREQIKGEFYTIGQRVKVYLESVESDTKGPGIKLSRIHPEMVRQLFEAEVPEIFAGTVEIKAIAREAGSRSKIAVYTEDESIDPIGSCVGQRGSRVNTIIEELGGEKIDIIEWNNKPEEFIKAALSPAKVLQVDLNEAAKKALVIVPEDQLSLAIGKKGQNVRLAVKLTGWDLDVETFEGKRDKNEEIYDEENEEKNVDEKVEEEKPVKEVEKEEKVEDVKENLEEVSTEEIKEVEEKEEVEEKPKKVRKTKKKEEK